MKLRYQFFFLLLLLILSCSVGTLAQGTPKSLSTSGMVNIEEELRNSGLPADVMIIKVNEIGGGLNDDAVVVMGSGMDALERQIFDALAGNYKLNSSYVVYDSTRTFQKKSLESYDLIVVGGPLHNSYTNELLGRGVLKYKTTDLVNRTGIVVETEKLPSGRTVIIVGSTAGYTYMYQAPQNYTPFQPGQNPVNPTQKPEPAPTGQAGQKPQIFGTYLDDPLNQAILMDVYERYTMEHAFTYEKYYGEPTIKLYEIPLGNGWTAINVIKELPSQEVLKKVYMIYQKEHGEWYHEFDPIEQLIESERIRETNQYLRNRDFYRDTVEKFFQEQDAMNNLEGLQ